MYIKYKKVLIFCLMLFSSAYFLTSENNDEQLSNALINLETHSVPDPEEEVEDVQGEDDEAKSFVMIWIGELLMTYKDVVQITACHFIQHHDDCDSLEVKILERLGKGLLNITFELGKYSKKLLFSSESALNKSKKIGAVVVSLLCVHFAVNTLSNRHKTS